MEYQPLDANLNEIRVLELLGGAKTTGSLVVRKLIHVSLHAHTPEYKRYLQQVDTGCLDPN